ncbi:GntR family transcriptional regulator [Rhizobium grahamii]|uniref:GntR family transcriptional regulator n=1 Tax=Rhizobium grahamii TaxID=1120045 RepID=A0A370KJJ1_9HYPH|nr:GntR family transcriptional regulator [Rhizobium grahamii]RDJ06724.1 GntR family transcriptional regulator [Rhizobium grahamii]
MSDLSLIERVSKELALTAPDVPLYKRLKSAIEAAIRSNAVKPGGLLPGERALAESLSLSRVTVRKALSLLEEEGLLNRRHGFRTEVGSRVEKSLSTLTSFSEDIRARGMEPGCIWLSKQISRPSPGEMMALGISASATVVRMRRVRTADGLPIAVESSTVPTRFIPSPDLVRDSLYEALAARSFMPQRAIQRMRSRAASSEDALHLNCEPGAPLLVTERRCFLPDEQIVEYCETRYKGEVYDFVFELQR